MRLKLDENIPVSAGMRLAALGLDVDTLLDEGLGGRADADVWAARSIFIWYSLSLTERFALHDGWRSRDV